jgi:peptidoglycan hydrolase-like protein with peptidoglycan-binding domain
LKRLIAVVLTLLVAGLAAWLVASRVESPDQVAARAEAPVPGPVTATLDRGFLQGPVSVSTTAQHERTITIKPPASLTGVVTFAGTPVGGTLRPGSVLLRANGRPVFVLPGSFALYRDLEPGATGDDVTAIQDGLSAAGYATGRDRSGTYGAGTQAAVRKLYKAAGYTAPEVTPAPEAPPAGTSPAAATPAPSAAPAAPVAGPRVLMTEVLMIADLPAVVQAVSPVGTQLTSDTDLVTLGAGQVMLSASLPSSAVGGLAVGAEGTFSDDAGGTGTARVSALAPDAAAGTTVVSLTATGAVTPSAAYVVALDNPAAESGESLLAPVAAVVSRGGRSYVYCRDGDAFREVEVEVTGSVGGVAAIVPVGDSVPLDTGTEVRVG